MGSAPGKVQEVDVTYEKPHYPPPSPPRFNFGDLFKNIPIHDEKDIADEGFDWNALEVALRVEEIRKAQEKLNEPDEIKAVLDANIQTNKDTGNDTKRTKDAKNEKNKKKNDKGDAEPEPAGIPMVFNSRKRIDLHAREAMPQHGAMFESLFSYLKQPIKKGFYPQTFFVRGLMVWLGFQNIEKGKYGPASLDSPNGILEHIKCQSLTYPKAFTLLCRAAGISCVLIDGYVKTGDYEAGDMVDAGAEDTWCAVYVDESWQLVHPLWICMGTYGRKVPGLVHIDSKEVIETISPNTDPSSKRKVIFNEDYFMNPPEEFVYKCYAKKEQWQLLPPAKVVKTPDDFMKLAYITKTFIRFGLTFISEASCILHSQNGKVRVELFAPPHMASRLIFQCILSPQSITAEGTANTQLSNTNYSKLVLSYRSNERFIFELRLPFEGNYRLEILGGIEKMYCLCRFVLICSEPLSPCLPLPVETGTLGWGPGPHAEKCGLILPSNPSGFITILPTEGGRIVPPSSAKPENVITISFQLGRNAFSKFEYNAELCASYSLAATNTVLTKDMKKEDQKANKLHAAKNLGLCVEGTRDHVHRLLRMKITVPREGEYALVIKATDCIIKKERKIPVTGTTRPICYYLLSAREDWAKQYTPEKLARRELHDAMADGNIERLEKAIAKCKSAKIPVVDSSVAAAELRIEYMKIRRDLDDCIKRRNGIVINDTLKRVIKYRYRSAFVDEIEELLQFKNNLLRLRGYSRGIFSLKEANEEMMKVARPLPEVHNTMKALLLMLGYYGNMDDWLVIQSTIKVAPDTLDFKNILKQMEELDDPSFPWKHVKRNHIEKVRKKLHKYSYDKVFKASQAAALFYEWVETCLAKVPKKEKPPQEVFGNEYNEGGQGHHRKRKRRGRKH